MSLLLAKDMNFLNVRDKNMGTAQFIQAQTKSEKNILSIPIRKEITHMHTASILNETVSMAVPEQCLQSHG